MVVVTAEKFDNPNVKKTTIKDKLDTIKACRKELLGIDEKYVKALTLISEIFGEISTDIIRILGKSRVNRHVSNNVMGRISFFLALKRRSKKYVDLKFKVEDALEIIMYDVPSEEQSIITEKIKSYFENYKISKDYEVFE